MSNIMDKLHLQNSILDCFINIYFTHLNKYGDPFKQIHLTQSYKIIQFFFFIFIMKQQINANHSRTKIEAILTIKIEAFRNGFISNSRFLLQFVLSILQINLIMQSQCIKLKVSIKKIAMNIKFPCSLAIQIKHDIPQDYRKLYELKNGQCVIGDIMQTQCEAIYNTTRMRFEDKKISINIFMVSNSGKVASGCVYFTLFGKQPGKASESVQFLEKCPDKQAKIYYTYSIQILTRIQRLDKTVLSEEPKKKLMSDSIHLPTTLRTPKNQDKQSFRKEGSPINRDKYRQSLVEDVLAFDRKPSFQFEVKQQTEIKYPLTQRFKTQLNQKISRSKSKKHVRQSVPAQTTQSFYVPAERKKLQLYQNLQQSQELLKVKAKLRVFENNEKLTAQNLRQTKQELQKKKNRLNQLEASKLELEESVRTKQDKIKKLEKQNKQITEQYEQITNQFKSLKSQFQIRQNINRQQVKKLEEKYRQSQIQRQKITQEYNKSLKNLEESEKRYQSSMKEKDKGVIQQRNKMTKKLQNLNNTIYQLQREKKQMQLSLQDLTSEKKLLINHKSELQNQLSEALAEVQNLSNRVKVESENNLQLQRQIETLRISEAEKIQFKKKLSENQLIINSLTQKNNTLQKNVKANEQAISKLENQLQKKSQQKTQLSLKLNQLKKSYQDIKFSEQQKIKQSKSLAQINVTANTRISDLKYKLQIEKRSLEEIQRQYQERYILINNQKNALLHQASELRWEIQKHMNSQNQLSMQIKTYNEQIYRLSETIIQRQERIKQLEEMIKQLTVSSQYLTASNGDLQKKKKEALNQIKEQNNELVQVKKKLEKTQRQLMDLKEKYKAYETGTKQKLSQLQKKLKQKDEIIQSKNTHIQSFQMQQRSLSDELSSLKQASMVLQNQMAHLRQTITNSRRQSQAHENLIIKLKASDADLKRMLSEKEEEISRKHKQIEQLNKKINVINEQNQKYINNCVHSLQKYFEELLKDSQNFSNKEHINRIQAYPDQRISSLQLQYAQKTTQNSFRIRTKLTQINQEKDIIQYELNKAKNQYQQTIKFLQQQLLRQKERIKVLNLQLSKRDQQQKSILTKDEELLISKDRELEHHKAQIIKKQEQCSELQAQIHILISQYESLKEENRQLQEKYLTLRSQEIKSKAQMQARNKQTITLYQEQIQQLKSYSLQYDKKISSYQKQLAEKIEILKRYQIQQNGIVYECDKRENRINQLSDRLRESQSSIRELQKQLRQKQKQLKKNTQNLEHLNSLLLQQKEKHEEVLFKVQQQNHIILSLSKELQQTKQERNTEKNQASQSQNHFKLRFQSLKTANQKIIQELKETKQKNISLASQLELKKFMITQLQHNINIQKELKQQLKSQLERKRLSLQKQAQDISILKHKIRQAQDKISVVEEQKQNLTFANEKLKQNLNQMKSTLREERNAGDQILNLERQIEKTNAQKRQLEQFYQRQISQIKASFRDNKRAESIRVTRQTQLQKKLKNVQKLLQSQHPDLALQRSRIIKQTQRDKKQLINKIETLQSKLEQVQSQLYTLKQKNRRQTQKLTHQLQQTKQQSNAKDFFVRNQQFQIDNLNNLLNEATSLKQKLQNQLEKEKNKFKKLQETVQFQQKQYMQKLKKSQEEEIKNITSEIEKKLNSSKFKKLNMNFNEVQKVMLIGYYRQIQEIIASTIKEKRY